MVHELLGLNDNRVVLKGAPGVRKDLEEVSFSLRPHSRCIRRLTSPLAVELSQKIRRGVLPPFSLADSRSAILAAGPLSTCWVSVCGLAQVVLSCTQDDFFARNRFSNFGDLGVAVKTLMDDYQKATRLNENINSIEDMQAFLERYVTLQNFKVECCGTLGPCTPCLRKVTS